MRHGLALSGVGAVCGLMAALALTRLMKSAALRREPERSADVCRGVSAVPDLAATVASYLRRAGPREWIRWKPSAEVAL